MSKIPDYPEWQEVTLGDLTKKSVFGPRFSSDLYSENGNVGTIRTTDLNEDGIINYQTIPYANLPEDIFKNHYLNNGDLLITRSGTCGVPCIFQRQEKPVVAGAFLIRFILKDTVNPIYLHMLLKSSGSQEKIQKMASGGVQKNLTGTNLKKLKIQFPPLPEQNKIALILSTWDKAIETVERLINNSKAQKKALMQQLLTGRRRLPGFEGERKTIKLSKLCKIGRGASPRPIKDPKWFAESGRGWVRISDITASPTHELLSTTQYLSKEGTQNSVCVDPGDLIMTICGTIGVPKFLGIPACIHDGFVVFRKCSRNISLEFLYHFLYFISKKLVSSGQPGTQKNLNTGIVGNIDFPTINFQEQQQIATLLTTADKKITTLQQKLDCLQQEKKALMQQLLTGKRRVKVDADG